MKSFKWLLVVILLFSGFFIVKNYVYSTTPPPEDLSSIPLEGEPRNLTINPYTDQAVVSSTRPNELSVIDLNTGQITTTLQVKKKPFGLAIDCGKNLALVSFKAHHRLSVIDLSTYQCLAEIPVGKAPCNVAVYETASGPHLGLTVNYGSDTVSVINLETFRVIKTLRVGKGPRDIAVDPGLKLALVVNEDTHNVAVIDLNSFRVTGWVPVGRRPRSISINPETHLAAVANGRENYITTIDLTNWQSLRIPVDKNPLDVAINPLDNRALVVCNKSHSLHLIDLDTHTTLQKYPLNRQTRGLAVNPFTNIAGVVDRQTDRLTLIQLPNPVPDIQSITPVTVTRGSLGTQVSIQGSGFIKTSTVTLQPSPATFPVIFVDNHNLTAILPAGLFTQAGSYPVTVNNPTPDGGPSNTLTLQVENPIPTLTALDPASAQAGGPGMTVKLYGTGFFPETTISINGQTRSCSFISGTALELPLGPSDLVSAGDLEIKAVNPGPGGGASNPMSFTVTAVNPIPVLSSLSPNSIKAGSPGFTLTLTGSNFISSSAVLFNNTPVSGTLVDNTRVDASIPGTAIQTAGSFPVTVQNPGPGGGSSGTLNFTVTPASNATPPPAGSFGKTYEDLIPPDATIPSYDPKRFSLITGLVKDGSGNPLAGVGVGIHGQSEYGTAQTDATGRFSIPLDGGGTITVAYQKTGFIPAHRQVQVGWNTIANVETIVLIPEDTAATAMTFDGNAATILTHKGSTTTDAFGSRSLTMVLTGDNRAWVKDAQGNEQPLTNITVRATEYPTPESMPAKLPPTSAFTYCAELAVDGAKSVRFEKPVVVYVDNFLGFNVGEIVPVGYYDRDRAVWVPSNNGVVVQLLDTNGDGLVDAYTDGQNQYAAPGLTDPNLYRPGAAYWRVELTHFTPWDCNWPIGFPSGVISPNPDGKPVTDRKCPDDDKRCINSYIEERSRIFHEDIPIPGTDMTLHYASDRTKGYKSVITIPASGPSVPASLKGIIVKLEVAGRSFETTLPPLPNQMAEFVWDGFDYLGRGVSGSTIADISIGFIYRAVYYSAFDSSWFQSFALVGKDPTYIDARSEAISWKRDSITLNQGATEAGALADGWTLSSHHYFHPTDPYTLYKGDGTTIKNNTKVITTIAGNGQAGYSGDGGPATQANLYAPGGIVLDSAGNIYIADTWNDRIRKVDTNGIISTIAGNGQRSFGGDGGPALQASFFYPSHVTLDNAGNLYIGDFSNHRVRRVDTNGIITTIAGNGQGGEYVPFVGDGGPATQTPLGYINGIAIDNAGNLYIADGWYNRIRKVDINGIITTIAGNGQWGYSGDGGPATQARLGNPNGVAVDNAGNIYIVDGYNTNRIRKVDISGIITTFAGNGQAGFSGDGGPAVQASLSGAGGIAVDNSKNIYIGDGWGTRIRKVDTNGIITTIAGNGQQGYSGDGGLAIQANLCGANYLAADSAGAVYIGDNGNHRIRKVSYPDAFKSVDTAGNTDFSDENGQGYVMSSTGLHKSTIDLAAGKTLLTFGYDSANKLVSITDRFGNQTTFQRDGSGAPISITSPDGIVTRLTVDGNNHLTSVTYPDNSAYSFSYTSDGLMTDKYDPRGNRFRHQFDANGRITNVFDPEGGAWNYSRIVDNSGTATVTLQTAEGNVTTYLDRTDSTGAYTSITTSPFGSISTFTRSSDGLTETEQPSCGMNQTLKYDLDPAYKYKYLKEFTQSSPAGLTQTTTDIRSYQDTNGDTIPDLITKAIGINGNNWTTINDTLAGTLTSTSPLGRGITRSYDPISLLDQSITVPGLFPISYNYDTKGRLISSTTGARTSTITYDIQGNIERILTPDQKTISYIYDLMGRLKTQTQPDNSLIGYEYDANGNMKMLINPKLINYGFDYTGFNLRKSMAMPLSGNYQYLYDKERNLKSIFFPSGKWIENTYTNGLLTATNTPEGGTNYTYNCISSLRDATKGLEKIAYTYDGSLLKTDTRTGLLNQVIGYSYNNNFRLASRTYGGISQSFTYDNDGLLTDAGAFTITHNAQNGFPETVSDGILTNSRTFSGYGELDGNSYSIGGNNKYSYTLTRDLAGWITQKVETVDGATDTFEYGYDTNGRLTEVKKNQSVVEAYTYDFNGNRLTETNNLRSINRSYTVSTEDHVITAGTETYQFDVDGFLTSKTTSAGTFSTTYSSRGELLSATLPGGTIITYDHDPFGRRVAKRVNGTITEKYLWANVTTLLAVYDGSDNLVMRFTYAYGRMPVSMTHNGSNYYFFYDQIGSLRAVSDATGNIVKRIDYDSFGSIISDTNPTIRIPFGFGGGFHDRDTGLVRFGVRDYDPSIGRWTAKDPIDFGGGDTNLYGYVLNNPTQVVDPSGLATWVCKKPLDFFGDNGDKSGTKSGPDIWGNPFYHEYVCVGNGKSIVCGGQSSGGEPYGRGIPSHDKFNPKRCDLRESNKSCLEKCLREKFVGSRPDYGLVGPGTNCQEWADDSMEQCKAQCKGK